VTYFLGIDAGQTVVKAVLFDESFNEIGQASNASPNDSPQPRFVQRSQQDLWKAASASISDAIGSAGVSPAEIKGVGIAGHGDGLHLVQNNGASVGEAIMAVDSRAWREMDEILSDQKRSQEILDVSGQVPFLGSTGVIMAWVKNNQPELLEQSDAMLFCKDVLRLRLTETIGTDYSDASASFLDVAKAEWSNEVLQGYGLGDYQHLLPKLDASTEIVAEVTSQGAKETGLVEGTSLVAGSHDVHAAALGMGSLQENMLTLIAGSFSINAVTTNSTATDPRWQSRVSLDTSKRISMSTSATASTTLQWVLKTLGIKTEDERSKIFQAAATIDQSDDLPILLPYLFASPFGETPSGTFLGLRSWHTPAHLIRATLEGIVWMHIWHTDALSSSFSFDGTVRLGGGISRSELYCQMVADALGSAVETIQIQETGAFGAAGLAAIGANHFSLEEIGERVRVDKRFEPNSSGVSYWENRKHILYQTHSALSPIWEKLSKTAELKNSY
jgi:L-xylulokinase